MSSLFQELREIMPPPEAPARLEKGASVEAKEAYQKAMDEYRPRQAAYEETVKQINRLLTKAVKRGEALNRFANKREIVMAANKMLKELLPDYTIFSAYDANDPTGGNI